MVSGRCTKLEAYGNKTKITKGKSDMSKFTRKPLAIVLAVVLVLSFSVTAFAAWPSFQNDNTNNGITAVQPPIAAPSVTAVPLPFNGSPYTGVDAVTIIDDGTAYTLYDGGTDGARLQATELASAGTLWNVVVDGDAIDGFQLSTPALVDGVLYIATTYADTSGEYYWHLSAVTNLGVNPPTVTALQKGLGETNTPIGYDSLGNIYFGTWTGGNGGVYYQFTPNATYGTLTPFTPSGGDDFYWAGAADVTIDGAEYMVFGSDNGILYVRPVAGFDVGTGAAIAISPTGQIRSTVVSAGDNVYFTSKVAGDDGNLFSIVTSTLLSASPTPNNVTVKSSETSTSTPVVSNNDIIYVGSSWYDSTMGQGQGTVQAFNLSLNSLGAVYTGDPVQSSPIVYTDEDTGYDYIFFTTNDVNGAGYCYRFSGFGTELEEWTYANTSGNNYSVQGMASDAGYLVWGDDGKNLYIARQ
jgi:hypothetical protein